jgi:hypothetical protein
MLAFMMEKLTPTMAETLGESLYDPATQKGFGCGNCHTMVPPKAAPAAAGGAKGAPVPPAGPAKAPPAATDAGKK